MAEAERQSSAPETTAGPPTPAGGLTTLATPAFGDVTSLVGALAAGPDDWRADVLNGIQRTSGNRAVMRMLTAPTAVPGSGAVLATKKKTGIGSDAATTRMAAEAKDVHDDWGKLSASQRARKLATQPLAELKAAGVPPFRVVVKRQSGTTAAVFDFPTWAMHIDPDFVKGKGTTAKVAEAAGIVAHEARHCEQWFRMARLQVARSKKPDTADIARRLGVPKRIVDLAATKPLDGKSPEATEARKWHESVYGGKRDHREKVLTDIDRLGKRLAAARKELAEVSAKPGVRENEIARARQKYNEAKKAFDPVYKQYRALPEEADAWIVGLAVEGKAKK